MKTLHNLLCLVLLFCGILWHFVTLIIIKMVGRGGSNQRWITIWKPAAQWQCNHWGRPPAAGVCSSRWFHDDEGIINALIKPWWPYQPRLIPGATTCLGQRCSISDQPWIWTSKLDESESDQMVLEMLRWWISHTMWKILKKSSMKYTPSVQYSLVPEEELKSEFNRKVARAIIPSNFPVELRL